MRLLGPDDRDAFLALTAQDPVVNVFADYRARVTNLDPRWLGGEMWGRFEGDELVAGCHMGANLVPVQCTSQDVECFAEPALSPAAPITVSLRPPTRDLVASTRSLTIRDGLAL